MSKNIIKSHTLRALVKSVTLAYIITLISLLVFALIVYKTYMSDGGIEIGIIVIYCISNLVSGFIIGKIQKNKKFLWGLLNGIIYVTLIILIAFIINGHFIGDEAYLIKAILSSVISGMIGGMLS